MAASATVLPGEAIAALVEASPLKEAAARVVVIDGVVARQLSDTDRLPQQVRSTEGLTNLTLIVGDPYLTREGKRR